MVPVSVRIVLIIDPDTDYKDYIWTLNGELMPAVTGSIHVRVLRSAKSEATAVAENIKNASRTVYSLMPSAGHDHNRDNNIPNTDMRSPGTHLWNGTPQGETSGLP